LILRYLRKLQEHCELLHLQAYTYTHSFISQRMEIFISYTVRTSNVTRYGVKWQPCFVKNVKKRTRRWRCSSAYCFLWQWMEVDIRFMPCPFVCPERAPDTHQIGCWVELSFSLDVLDRGETSAVV
jgi:hypothetical protein